MSVWRRQRKRGTRATLAVAGLFFLLIALPPMPEGRAATTERVVTDPTSGLALSGFDPVAYFTDAKPLLGKSDLEMSFAGTVWRFRNEGNRAAFAQNPEVYVPAFGGHDPVGVARGVARPGHPEIWMVLGDRLYLFYNAEAKKAFAESPDTIVLEAEKKWPAVTRGITP